MTDMRAVVSAERVLREITAFRDGLDKRTDRELIAALDRVVEVVQNHFYHAYLEVREFYETTLLSTAIPVKIKADMALDIAGRWEQIDQSSSALSASHIHSEHNSNELTGGERSRSLSHIARSVALDSGAGKNSTSKDHTSVVTSSFCRLNLGRRHQHPQRHHKDNQEWYHTHRTRNDTEPLFDDSIEASSQSPSFGSVSVSNSFMEQRRICSPTFRVQLSRGPQGFGFSIAGGTDQETPLPTINPCFVYVARITPGGVADSDGRLRVNDVILSVNGVGLVGLPHLKAVTIFEQCGAYLDLEVQRPSSALMQEAVRPVHLPTSPKISSTVSRLAHTDGGGSEGIHAATTQSRFNPLSRSRCIILPAASNSSSSTESSGPPPTTVSPLSSLITSCHHPPTCNSTNAEITMEKVAVAAMETSAVAATQVVGEENRHVEGDVEKEEKDDDDDDDTVWFFDPEQTGSGRSVSQAANNVNNRNLDADATSSSIKATAKDNELQKIGVEGINRRVAQSKKPPPPIPISQWELSTRPQPDPPPGPVIVEVPLVRGTSNGFGFSIAGGIGTEFLEGDSGIFITKVTSGGVADTSGRIAVGDRLIRVNSVSLVDVTHAKAVEALNTAGDFALLLLVKVSLHSSPQRINCQQCQEDYAAAHAVPESILQRWPRARLVTLYKEESQITGSSVGERSSGSLGFNIVSGDGTTGIYVSHIHPKGPAASSMAISIGDRLLTVSFVLPCIETRNIY
ncbi:unnamed protein product [Hydatigera taeniaeformis]|uniref:PDZ domain-containing protein n=1 Tax=Hydatigena taeniaeformis TaxID=6205 RepID=A0A0R3X7G9_HYDTA|nr:unnamed protein product [Hydatigera taeniaeformis]